MLWCGAGGGTGNGATLKKPDIAALSGCKKRNGVDGSKLRVRSQRPKLNAHQGCHGTGKTGNLVLTFSRQGKHREFCFDTGKNSETQGKYFSLTQGKI